jgi:hypothetical protein
VRKYEEGRPRSLYRTPRLVRKYEKGRPRGLYRTPRLTAVAYARIGLTALQCKQLKSYSFFVSMAFQTPKFKMSH